MFWTAAGQRLRRLAPPHMPLPAVIRCVGETVSRTIAGLTVLDRLVVAAYRAGCRPITILASGPPPALKRARELGIEAPIVSKPPPSTEPVLALESGWLLQAADLRRVVDQGGRLVAADGTPLPAGVLTQARWDIPLDRQLDGLPEVKAAGRVPRRKGISRLLGLLGAAGVPVSGSARTNSTPGGGWKSRTGASRSASRM